MKTKIKIGVLLLIFFNVFMISSCKKVVEPEKSFPEMVSEMSSYKLEGKLESMFPSGTKECEVVVYYKEPNLFRVELTNAGNNEPQVMIKNEQGIYVLLPTVNKIFKVDSSWPDNSSYPYILQSLSKDIISDENLITLKEDSTTTLEFNAKMFDNAVVTKQKVIFDNTTALPKEVLIYDDLDSLIVRFVVDKIEVDAKIDNELFKVNDAMSALRVSYTEDPLSFDRLITYPTYYPSGSSLIAENVVGDVNQKTAFMKFGGDTPFTVIEQYVHSTDDTKTTYVSGNIYIMGGAICVAANNTIFFYDAGIEYTLASNHLDYVTLIKVGESLRTANIK